MQETGFVALSWLYSSLTLALVVNRLHVKALQRNVSQGNLLSNWSDAFVAIAWIFVFTETVCDTALYIKIGQWSKIYDNSDISHENLDKSMLYNIIIFVEGIIYYLPIYLVKFAILCFLMDLTPVVLVGIRRAIWTGLVFVVLGVPLTSTLLFYLCRWPKQLWQLDEKYPGLSPLLASHSSCYAPTLGLLLYHMATDIYIYVIPFFLMRHLPRTVSMSQRLLMYGMFGAGFALVGLACGQMDFRIPRNIQIMWDFWFGLHEQHLAITVACLPQLRLSTKRYLDTRKSNTEDTNFNDTGCRDRRRRSWMHKIRRGKITTLKVARARPEGGDALVIGRNVESCETKEAGPIDIAVDVQETNTGEI